MMHWYLLSNKTGMQVWRKHQSTFLLYGFFAANELDIAAFRHFLQQHDRDRFCWLCDEASETVHHEHLPAVPKKLASQILNRRLQQRFAAVTYRTSVLQAPPQVTGQSWLGQLLVIEREDSLEPWQSVIEASGICLLTIQSVFTLLARSGLAVPVTAGQHAIWLIVSQTHSSVLVYGKTGLILVRKLPQHLSQQFDLLHEEIQKTGYFAYQQTGDAVRMDEVSVHVSFEGEHDELASRRIALPGWTLDEKPEAYFTTLLLHTLAGRHREPGFLPALAKRTLQLLQWRRFLWGGVVATSVLLLGAVAFVYHAGQLLTQEQTQLMRAHETLRLQVQKVNTASTPLIEQAREVVQTHHILGQWPEPYDWVFRLSQCMVRFPAMRLQEMQWQVMPANKSKVWPPEAMSLTFRGFFLGTAEDMVARNAQVAALQGDLTRYFPGTSIQVLQWPVDIKSTAEISSEALHATAGAGFSMQISHLLSYRQ